MVAFGDGDQRAERIIWMDAPQQTLEMCTGSCNTTGTLTGHTYTRLCPYITYYVFLISCSYTHIYIHFHIL